MAELKFYIRKDDGAIMRLVGPGRYAKHGTVAEYLRLRKAQRRERKREEQKRLAAGVITQVDRDRAAKEFWDQVDTSEGAAACHSWVGERQWNHPEDNVERYQRGAFSFPGLRTRIATRVLCYLTFGREVPEHLDITPLCGNHLCCNVEHIAITPHGPPLEGKLKCAIPVQQFFAGGDS